MAPRRTLSIEQLRKVRRLWDRGASQREICEATGITVDRFRARLRDQLRDLPQRPRRANSGLRGRDPSESEIEAACIAIRSRWSEDERIAHL
jgi:hypothetical protein